MIFNLYSKRILKTFSYPILLYLIFFNFNIFNKEVKSEKKLLAATEKDLFLYRQMGASYLCIASKAGIEFPKAVGIAAATYAQVLNGRHGGFVASAGDKKLTSKQLFAGAEFQIITAALQYCPISECVANQTSGNDFIYSINSSKITMRERCPLMWG